MPDSSPLARAAAFTWRALVVAVGVLAVVWVLSRLRVVVLPVIVALLFATILVPPVDALVRRRVPRLAATWLVLLFGAALLAVLVVVLVPAVRSEFKELGPTLTEGRKEVQQWLTDGPLGLSEGQLERYIDQGREAVVGGNNGSLLSGVITGATLAIEVVAGILLTLVLVFFFVKDGPKMCDYFLARVNEEHHELLRSLGRRSWAAAGGYVRGTALVALVDAVVIGLGLLVIGVPLVLPLAVLTFFGAFFPLVGAVTAGILAALVALVSGGFQQALLVTALVVAVQQIEGDVLQPLVVGRAVSLHPVVILLVLTAGAVLGGLVGAFLAVPVTAVVVAAGHELRVRGIGTGSAISSTGGTSTD